MYRKPTFIDGVRTVVTVLVVEMGVAEDVLGKVPIMLSVWISAVSLTLV